MAHFRPRPWHFVISVFVVAIVALIFVWNWDWFIAPVERIASARAGRKVTIQHLHLSIARNPVVEIDGLTIGNPDGFPAEATGDKPFAHVQRLAVTVNGPAYLHGQVLIVPNIEIDRPEVQAVALPDGRNNWTFPFSSAPSGGKPGSSARIGDLRISDGHVHAVDPKLKADFNIDVATQDDAEHGQPSKLVATTNGTYAGQPITGRFTGGALLTLRDKTNPYPVDLQLANGATKVSLQGTVLDPLAFAGTNLKLRFEGRSLGDLLPLTGVAAPATPPYVLTGDLAYADKKVRFDHFQGRIGNSDIEGDIDVDPGAERPVVTATLASRTVDLADLGGFIGSTPGRVTTQGESKEQRAEVAHAEASPRLIPDTPINLPRLRAADVDLHYKGDHIQGRSVPFDDIVVDLTVKDGAVQLHPVSLGVGHGRISGNVVLSETSRNEVHARTSIDFQKVDVGRLLSATHAFGGAGSIAGKAEIDGTGRSLAAILGSGNGDVKLFMSGGDLSALLVDLSGLEFGNALLSALGVPKRTEVRCLVSDFVLKRGILETRTLLLDTGEANVTGKGSVDLRNETIDYQLRTQAKHFSIGSLPAPIDITGHLKSPSVRPDEATLAARGGLAIGLGVLLTPLAALLPTIQLGLGEDNNCSALIRNAQRAPNPAEHSASR